MKNKELFTLNPEQVNLKNEGVAKIRALNENEDLINDFEDQSVIKTRRIVSEIQSNMNAITNCKRDTESKKTNPKNKKDKKHNLVQQNHYNEEDLKSEVVEKTDASEGAKDIDTNITNDLEEVIAAEPLSTDRNKHVSKSRKRINRRRRNSQRNKNLNNENQDKTVVNNRE